MSDRSINFCYRLLLWATLFQNLSAQTAGGRSAASLKIREDYKKNEMTRWRIGSEIEPRSYTITTKHLPGTMSLIVLISISGHVARRITIFARNVLGCKD